MGSENSEGFSTWEKEARGNTRQANQREDEEGSMPEAADSRQEASISLGPGREMKVKSSHPQFVPSRVSNRRSQIQYFFSSFLLKFTPLPDNEQRSHRRNSKIHDKPNNFDEKTTLTMICSKYLSAPDFNRDFSPETCDPTPHSRSPDFAYGKPSKPKFHSR
jgi:hypothetical protein